MAKIRVSSDLIREFLFAGADLAITDVASDPQTDVFIFEISGPAVPDTDDEVDCVMTLERRRIEFRPRDEPPRPVPADVKAKLDSMFPGGWKVA